MSKANVLVIGNSGVGKSTLINAVLGENVAKTGWGTSGTTKKLEIYESTDESIPFRIIDTIGFEPDFINETRAVNAVKKWSKDCAKEGKEDHQINVIWFCVDGTSRKLFPKTIKNLTRAVSMWESVPVIVAITKSYSVPERQENVDMVNNAFDMQKKHASNLRRVIPVVAAPYVLNETAFAPPEGIVEIISATNELIPEGKRAADKDLRRFILSRKRVLSHGVVSVATAAASVVGAVPIKFPDALILTPTEIAEVNAIAKIYGIKNDEDSKRFLDSIVEVGTVSTAAKTLISALKAIPGINIAASVMNAIIAGSIAAALGEGTIYAFEQVYLGKKSISDIDWVKKLIESKLSIQLVDKVKKAFEKLSDASSKNDIVQAIMEAIFSLSPDVKKIVKE